MSNEPVKEPNLVASSEAFSKLASRIGLNQQERLDPKLVKFYTAEQFGAWQQRKEVNAEPHQDSLARFSGLPEEVQENIARMAEARLLVLKKVLSDDAFIELVNLGEHLKSLINQQYDGNVTGLLDAAKSELQAKIDRNEAINLDLIEDFFKSRFSFEGAGFRDYSDLFLRIHHGLWHSNLDKAHEFAFKMDALPTDPVIVENDPNNPKSRPYGLRAFSDKANLIGILGQVIALANTVNAGHKDIMSVGSFHANQLFNDTLPTVLRDQNSESFIKNLDANAVINN